MKARSSTISPGVLPSYSAPLSRSGAHQFPWGCKLWRWGAQTLSVKSISETPAAPPTPSYTSSKGASALSRASPSLSQMCQVHEPIWGLREKIPPWTKPRWAVRVSVPMEAGMRTQSPVLPPQRFTGSLPALKKGPSRQPPLESRAESNGAPHHCGQIGLGRAGDHLPPGSSPFRSCQDSLVSQGFLYPGKFCELLENHDFSSLNFLHWNARSNQPILKEISPEYSLERLMLKLKVQYFGHLIQTDNSLEKSLVLGKIEGRRRRGWQRTRRWMASPTNKFNYQDVFRGNFFNCKVPYHDFYLHLTCNSNALN